MPHTASVEISSIASQQDADAFRALNEEWITRLFSMEKGDRVLLEDPFGHVVEPGGDVLLARDEDGTVLGGVALLRYPDGVFELTKMGVLPAAQGRGLGRRLVAAAIDRARELGCTRLFLGSHSSLAPAIHLYEEAGFVHVSRDRLPLDDEYYDRADVFMELM
ncbi:GNAT family N-acetyltransferase [Nocardiopsis sp. RSe5-2]|uniref:GNAT family N-acetyltransferase n=1 Tax=Nocardiopsis endophytica TaxID=3018445 RepID=A0ABT4TZ97_9ACTN|nr:GNAT family N-acetyltransferase [Nocardiopsis endophytica]MDA2809555.1 GNAT family N-acetyltransferase [Nocardiopsis endophytica]